MGFAMAQFIGAGGVVVGKNPGLRNAAAMSGDLVDLGGGLSKVLREFPNGGSTSTLPTFNSLANLLTICRGQDVGCARLLSKARAPGGAAGHGHARRRRSNIARYPWHDARGLYKLSLAAARRRGTWSPALATGEERPTPGPSRCASKATRPASTAPATSRSTPKATSGSPTTTPTAAESRRPACGSDKVFRFTPTGQTYPGSPYVGGGLSGVGFGITIDPSDRVWLGNFGFEGKGCETRPNHFTASVFNLAGEALSPPGGWEVGGISWPQGTVSDHEGNIWLANCGNDSVTEITPPDALTAEGTPPSAVNFGGAADHRGQRGRLLTRPSATRSTRKATSSSPATRATRSPSWRRTAASAIWPPAAACTCRWASPVDSNGYVWVSNSKWVVAPCRGKVPKKQVSEKPAKAAAT